MLFYLRNTSEYCEYKSDHQNIIFITLQPLRSLWQGAEGIIWLCVSKWEDIKSGEFYLDRTVQPKHIAGM